VRERRRRSREEEKERKRWKELKSNLRKQENDQIKPSSFLKTFFI